MIDVYRDLYPFIGNHPMMARPIMELSTRGRLRGNPLYLRSSSRASNATIPLNPLQKETFAATEYPLLIISLLNLESCLLKVAFIRLRVLRRELVERLPFALLSWVLLGLHSVI